MFLYTVFKYVLQPTGNLFNIAGTRSLVINDGVTSETFRLTSPTDVKSYQLTLRCV